MAIKTSVMSIVPIFADNHANIENLSFQRDCDIIRGKLLDAAELGCFLVGLSEHVDDECQSRDRED